MTSNPVSPVSIASFGLPMSGRQRQHFDAGSCGRGLNARDLRSGGAFRFSYRDAGINQPNGVDAVEGSYFRETFAFLDGRKLDVTPIHFTGNPIADAQLYPRAASTQVRDLVQRASNGWLTGAHDGGVNVITRNFEIEFRDQRRLNDDLGAVLTGAGGVRF